MSENTPKSPGKSAHPGLQPPFKPGPDPRRGRGPKPGAPNAGRPHEEFKKLCQGLATRGAIALEAKRVMEDPKHPAFQGALRWATEHGYGRPEQPVALSGGAVFEMVIRREDPKTRRIT